ncbi:hypothetical protein AB5J72_01630 [Streptomyces sp. CG1]|uniref:hypothetical protein n=1 Tax=Streptomyces sp. CG1 TaxID=1287523 RepID=UPI0034E23171
MTIAPGGRLIAHVFGPVSAAMVHLEADEEGNLSGPFLEEREPNPGIGASSQVRSVGALVRMDRSGTLVELTGVRR